MVRMHTLLDLNKLTVNNKQEIMSRRQNQRDGENPQHGTDRAENDHPAEK